MSNTLFNDKETSDNVIDKIISESLRDLTKALINNTTNFSKREVKPLAILTTNRFINRIIKNYPEYKKQLENNFEKSLQNAIQKFCLAIGNRNQNEQEQNVPLLKKFFKRT